MEKNGPKIMRGAMTPAGRMWAPILPPVSEPKTTELSPSVALGSLLISTPSPITIPSGMAARVRTLKEM